jgi:hypothetical protein
MPRSKGRGVRCDPAGLGAGPADRPAGPGLLHIDDLVIFDGRQQVARHDRFTGRLEAHFELDHYLEAPIRKPGALPVATALEQARAAAGTRVNNVRREHI